MPMRPVRCEMDCPECGGRRLIGTAGLVCEKCPAPIAYRTRQKLRGLRAAWPERVIEPPNPTR